MGVGVVHGVAVGAGHVGLGAKIVIHELLPAGCRLAVGGDPAGTHAPRHRHGPEVRQDVVSGPEVDAVLTPVVRGAAAADVAPRPRCAPTPRGNRRAPAGSRSRRDERRSRAGVMPTPPPIQSCRTGLPSTGKKRP